MKIQKIISQSRRDFIAVYECEHCEDSFTGSGYDDSNYHVNVIPKIKCRACGKTAGENYRPLTTKYPDSAIV